MEHKIRVFCHLLQNKTYLLHETKSVFFLNRIFAADFYLKF